MSETSDEKSVKQEQTLDSTNPDGFSELLIRFLREYRGYLKGVLKNDDLATTTKNSHLASYLCTEEMVRDRLMLNWSDFAHRLDCPEKSANG
jgi:hypothetical protein